MSNRSGSARRSVEEAASASASVPAPASAGATEIRIRRRNAARRKAMLGSGGGTKQSERAVAAALTGSRGTQMPDGSWSIRNFNSRGRARRGRPGMLEFHLRRTAFGVLPFLGAGQRPTREVLTAGTFKPASPGVDSQSKTERRSSHRWEHYAPWFGGHSLCVNATA